MVGADVPPDPAAYRAPMVCRDDVIDPSAVRLHLPVMLTFTIALFFMAYNWSGTIRVSRAHGAILLTGFLAYIGLIAYQTF